MPESVTQGELNAVREGLRERIDVHRAELNRHGDSMNALERMIDERLTRIETEQAAQRTLLETNNELMGKGIVGMIGVFVAVLAGALSIIIFGPTR